MYYQSSSQTDGLWKDSPPEGSWTNTQPSPRVDLFCLCLNSSSIVVAIRLKVIVHLERKTNVQKQPLYPVTPPNTGLRSQYMRLSNFFLTLPKAKQHQKEKLLPEHLWFLFFPFIGYPAHKPPQPKHQKTKTKNACLVFRGLEAWGSKGLCRGVNY